MNKKYVLVMTVVGTGLVGGYTRASETDLHSRALAAKRRYNAIAQYFPDIPELQLHNPSLEKQIETYTWYAQSLETLAKTTNKKPPSFVNAVQLKTPFRQSRRLSTCALLNGESGTGEVLIQFSPPQNPSNKQSSRPSSPGLGSWIIGAIKNLFS